MHHLYSVSQHKDASDLATQAEIIFATLQISASEERFSANYPPNDHYFLGHAINASVLVCDADDEDAAMYPYWIIVKKPMPWGNPGDSPSIPIAELASALTNIGLSVHDSSVLF